MPNLITFQKFQIEVLPSPETNDHEVRFYGDDDDIIALFWNDAMGLDPDDIFREDCSLRADSTPHLAQIARCSCGVLGCGDIELQVQLRDEYVQWIDDRRGESKRVFVAAGAGLDSDMAPLYVTDEFLGRIIQFDANQYSAEVERALIDWQKWKD